MSNIEKAVNQIFTSPGFYGAVLGSICIITLGVLITKIKIIKNNHDAFKNNLNNFVVLIALPFAIISSYMSDLELSDLKTYGYVLALSCFLSFGLHILAFIVAKFMPQFYSKKYLAKKYALHFSKLDGVKYSVDNPLDVDQIYSRAKTEHRQMIMIDWLLVLNNSVTFFGLPMVMALFGQAGAKIVLIFQIPPVIFTYTVGSVIFSKVKFNKENFGKSMYQTFVNPMMMSLMVGIVLWLTQLIPGAGSNSSVEPKTGFGIWFSPWNGTNTSDKNPHGWFNFKETLPPVYTIIQYIAAMSTPLIWIITGMNISKLKIKKLLSDPKIWNILVSKYIAFTVFMMAILIGLTYAGAFSNPNLKFFLGGTDTGNNQVAAQVAIPASLMILVAVPTTPVFTTYAVKYKNHESYVSSVVGITALFSAIMMPVWFIIGFIVFSAIDTNMIQIINSVVTIS